MLTRICAVAVIMAGTLAGTARAETWTLDGDASHVAFGSIKKDKIGEVHSFSGLTGTVAADGTAEIAIDLSTVETNIEIRNERMIEHVFKGAGTAVLKTAVDMEEVAALEVGASTVVDIEGTLTFVGTDVEIEAEMFVMRLTETDVMVTTNDMIFLNTEDAGITAGIDKLMELADLPGITRTSPVTLRLIFQAEQKKAEAAPAAPAAEVATKVAVLTGDPKAGKKVFRKCKACHSLKAGKNGVGPSLHAILERPAGVVDGAKYSDAMAASGLTWDAETLTAFLKSPKGLVKGTTMSFRGLKKDDDVSDVIAYLAEQQ
ncbi:MAG: cytochrome c family protein [Pseudomonadota bacterium]